MDEAVARLAATLGATYGLRAIDAVHLPTGVAAGAERFLTNSSFDFAKAITEIDVTYPNDLAEPWLTTAAALEGALTRRAESRARLDAWPVMSSTNGAGRSPTTRWWNS